MDASKQIDKYIAGSADWEKKFLTQFRELIHEVMPNVTENWKWDVPVWSGKKLIAAASTFKNHLKFNFFKGARLKDPNKIINSGLESKQHRSINVKEGDKVNVKALKELIREAVELDS